MTEHYEQLEVDIDDDTKKELIKMFVKERLDPVSQATFEDRLTQGSYLEDALFDAVINEMVLQCLKEHIAHHLTNRDRGVQNEQSN